jgi:ClpP class serine protease
MDAGVGPMARAALRESPLSEREQDILRDRLAALYAKTLDLLARHRAKLLAVADALETQELLTGEAVRALAEAA